MKINVEFPGNNKDMRINKTSTIENLLERAKEEHFKIHVVKG